MANLVPFDLNKWEQKIGLAPSSFLYFLLRLKKRLGLRELKICLSIFSYFGFDEAEQFEKIEPSEDYISNKQKIALFLSTK